jgi:hypothetical protein
MIGKRFDGSDHFRSAKYQRRNQCMTEAAILKILFPPDGIVPVEAVLSNV